VGRCLSRSGEDCQHERQRAVQTGKEEESRLFAVCAIREDPKAERKAKKRGRVRDHRVSSLRPARGSSGGERGGERVSGGEEVGDWGGKDDSCMREECPNDLKSQAVQRLAQKKATSFG